MRNDTIDSVMRNSKEQKRDRKRKGERNDSQCIDDG